jgi:hypothetical protein
MTIFEMLGCFFSVVCAVLALVAAIVLQAGWVLLVISPILGALAGWLIGVLLSLILSADRTSLRAAVIPLCIGALLLGGSMHIIIVSSLPGPNLLATRSAAIKHLKESDPSIQVRGVAVFRSEDPATNAYNVEIRTSKGERITLLMQYDPTANTFTSIVEKSAIIKERP